MFSKIKLDGGSNMAVMGSTSDKMYLCQVPNFGILNDKVETGRLTCTSIKVHVDVGLMIEDLLTGHMPHHG
jgi:hypothetical protein